MLTIQSSISRVESVKRLLLLRNTVAFFSDEGIDKFMACHSTFSALFLPVPKFNVFSGVKYFCHTFKYLERPAIMESPRNKVFAN